MSECKVYKEPCGKHNFIHGAEAEELREGIEKLIADPTEYECGHDLFLGVSVDDLQDLLDRVDARDSLAYREAKER
jgi:hypothetical protein